MKKNIYIHRENMHNEESPCQIVPILWDIFRPKSVIDVGCGLGTFLKVFKDIGVETVLGLDGEWVDLQLLSKSINPVSEFLKMDLQVPFSLDKKFDLAISLEVAEHISAASADIFIKNLTGLSDVIVFSAAIPNQGGQNHLNEQWVSYWEQKFSEQDFILLDILRPIFWDNDKIFCWYKQNITLYMHKDYTMSIENLKKYSKNQIKDYVHPELYKIKATQLDTIVYGQYSLYGYVKLFLKGILKKVGISFNK